MCVGGICVVLEICKISVVIFFDVKVILVEMFLKSYLSFQLLKCFFVFWGIFLPFTIHESF